MKRASGGHCRALAGEIGRAVSAARLRESQPAGRAGPRTRLGQPGEPGAGSGRQQERVCPTCPHPMRAVFRPRTGDGDRRAWKAGVRRFVPDHHSSESRSNRRGDTRRPPGSTGKCAAGVHYGVNAVVNKLEI